MKEGSHSRSDDATNGRVCLVQLRVEFAYFGLIVIAEMPTTSCQTLCPERIQINWTDKFNLLSLGDIKHCLPNQN